MTTGEVEAKIYQALKRDKKLLSKLGNQSDSIFHNQAPPLEAMTYPALVYTLTSYKPFFCADNEIWTREAKIRIHILTQNAEDAAIESEIERIMIEELKAIRYDRTPYKENKEQIVILDYRMRINCEPPEKIEPQKPEPKGSDTKKHHCHCTTETTKINLITNGEIDTFFEDLEKEGK